MAASVNKIILIGNLGKQPELKQTKSGKPVASFSLATSEKYNNETKTEWHNIVAWNKTAELCGQYLKKGSKVYIEGKLQTRSWDDQNGNKRYTTEVIANIVQFLDSKSNIQLDRTYEENDGNTYGGNIEPIENSDLPF